MNRRFTNDLVGDAPSLGRRAVESDVARPFGSRRSGPANEVSAEPDLDAGRSEGLPFGGSTWERFDNTPDLDEEEIEEGQPRRRGPQLPTHPRKTVAAVGSSVRILRDGAGIPHIIAKVERDAYAALGFCMAQDCLRDLDLLRRFATGRAAEVLGADALVHDALVRTAGVPRRAQAAATRLQGGARDTLAAFATGINAVRAEKRPAEEGVLEIDPWTVADSLAIELLLAWSASLRVWPTKLLAARTLAVAGLDRAGWVAGERMDPARVLGRDESLRSLDLGIIDVLGQLIADFGLDGSAVARVDRADAPAVRLAGSLVRPHVSVRWSYVAHIEARGLSLAGMALLGCPVFPLARSAQCAWGVSGARAEESDCAYEELDGIGNYRRDGRWEKLNTRHEILRVRGGESVPLEVAETRNGPLVSHLAEQLAGRPGDPRRPGISVRWGTTASDSWTSGWLAVARARDRAEMAAAAAALDRGPVPVALVVGCGSGGCDQHVVGAGVGAARARSEAGRAATSAGSSSASTAASGRGDWSAGRESSGATVRLGELVEALPELSREAALALLEDTVDVAARRAIPAVARALRAAGGEVGAEDLSRAATLVESWDGDASAGSAAAAVFYVATSCFLPRILVAQSRLPGIEPFGPLPGRILAALASDEASHLFVDAAARDRAIVEAFTEAIAWLRDRQGPVESAWSWGAAIDPLGPSPGAAESAPRDGSLVAGSPFSVFGMALRPWPLPFRVMGVSADSMYADLTTSEVHVGISSKQEERDVSAAVAMPSQLAPGEAGSSRTTTLTLTADVQGDLTELVSG